LRLTLSRLVIGPVLLSFVVALVRFAQAR